MINQKKQCGFTLIEVMVALAILAVVAVAASHASYAYIRSVENLKMRTLAHFVAQNTASNLRMSEQPITTKTENKVDEQGKSWQVILTPTSLTENDTANNGISGKLNQVLIQVAPIVEGDIKTPITDMTIILANSDSN